LDNVAKQDFELSNHARNMLYERAIKEDWLFETLEKSRRGGKPSRWKKSLY